MVAGLTWNGRASPVRFGEIAGEGERADRVARRDRAGDAGRTRGAAALQAAAREHVDRAAQGAVEREQAPRADGGGTGEAGAVAGEQHGAAALEQHAAGAAQGAGIGAVRRLAVVGPPDRIQLGAEAVGQHDAVVGRDRVVDQRLRPLRGSRIVVDRDRRGQVLRDRGGAKQRAERHQQVDRIGIQRRRDGLRLRVGRVRRRCRRQNGNHRR